MQLWFIRFDDLKAVEHVIKCFDIFLKVLPAPGRKPQIKKGVRFNKTVIKGVELIPFGALVG